MINVNASEYLDNQVMKKLHETIIENHKKSNSLNHELVLEIRRLKDRVVTLESITRYRDRSKPFNPETDLTAKDFGDEKAWNEYKVGFELGKGQGKEHCDILEKEIKESAMVLEEDPHKGIISYEMGKAACSDLSGTETDHVHNIATWQEWEKEKNKESSKDTARSSLEIESITLLDKEGMKKAQMPTFKGIDQMHDEKEPFCGILMGGPSILDLTNERIDFNQPSVVDKVLKEKSQRCNHSTIKRILTKKITTILTTSVIDDLAIEIATIMEGK